MKNQSELENMVKKFIKEDQVVPFLSLYISIRQIQLTVAFRDQSFWFKSWQESCCRNTAKNEEESKDAVKVYTRKNDL
eukprot:1629476-Heterocapsa_arctica.AAC.1